MQLLAKRSFKNPSRRLQIPGAVHPDHVHKGAVFSIGDKAEFKELGREDRELVGLLNLAECIGEPTPENIERINAQLAEEEQVEARAKATAQAALRGELKPI